MDLGCRKPIDACVAGACRRGSICLRARFAVHEVFVAQSALMFAQVPEHVQRGYEKAQAAVALRKANEAAVAPGKVADSELLAAYMAYTKLEEAQGDPARVQVPPRRSLLALKANVCTGISLMGRLLDIRPILAVKVTPTAQLRVSSIGMNSDWPN